MVLPISPHDEMEAWAGGDRHSTSGRNLDNPPTARKLFEFDHKELTVVSSCNQLAKGTVSWHLPDRCRLESLERWYILHIFPQRYATAHSFDKIWVLTDEPPVHHLDQSLDIEQSARPRLRFVDQWLPGKDIACCNLLVPAHASQSAAGYNDTGRLPVEASCDQLLSFLRVQWWSYGKLSPSRVTSR